MAGIEVKGIDGATIRVSDHFDCAHWIDRWDRMQRRYLARREERFTTTVELIRACVPSPAVIVDLGCGTGSLAVRLAETFERATVIGIDFDPTILLLAQARATSFDGRVKLLCQDLRGRDWAHHLPETIDAAVSAAALHWFSPMQLATVYKQLAGHMRCGGIFLNADHAGNEDPRIQARWEAHKQQMRESSAATGADDWRGFWTAYAEALQIDIGSIQESLWNPSDWVEPGLPLAWHFDRLREVGFTSVDCFWRCDGDAIYGGVRA